MGEEFEQVPKLLVAVRTVASSYKGCRDTGKGKHIMDISIVK